ncbi:esterase-like activity of phytase family protein [Maritalea sp.]|uniref:esterase-like activity of phytase family protein n=1 Tax=Maritalea sp. TaxID=2003361 RepID=UPI0039E6AA6F
MLLGLLGTIFAPSNAFAEKFNISATPIKWFKGQAIGKPVGTGLIWRGGLQLKGNVPNFGGLSDLTIMSTNGGVAMVTDTGYLVAGQISYDQKGAPVAIQNATIEPIKNSKGVKLPNLWSRDSEAIDTIYRNGEAVAVRIGFENLTRVADFALLDGRPGGAAKDYIIPTWLTQQRNNWSIESLCIAPPASPVAGSTLMIAEDVRNDKGNNRAWLSGKRDGGDLSVAAEGGFRPTGCAFTQAGDLLILYRDVGIFGFSMQLRKIAAAQVQAGQVLFGEKLLEANGGDVDNMEGLATHIGANGETIISILSDDNFRGWERTLLLQFELVK